ncbi:MAG: flippase-like domain-containing protein [Acidobacteria bacterium]|nr:flippase-like domain-containing protein [Acidobacteriota bacterium]
MLEKKVFLRTARVVLTSVAAAVLFYLAVRGAELVQVWQVVKEMQWSFFSGALVLVLISPFARAWRWKELFRGKVPGYGSLLRAVVTGQTLNFVIPMRSGEVARVFMVGGRRLQVAGTLALEKFLDLSCFLALCLLLPLIWVMPQWLEGPLKSVTLTTGLYLSMVIALAVILPRIKWTAQILHIPRLEKLPVLLGTSFFLWSSSVLVNYFVLLALQVGAPFIAAIVVLIILQVGIAVPSTPGKLGVFQYLAVVGLSLFGVDQNPALAFGLVLHLVVFLPSAVMAALFWATQPARQPVEISA